MVDHIVPELPHDFFKRFPAYRIRKMYRVMDVTCAARKSISFDQHYGAGFNAMLSSAPGRP